MLVLATAAFAFLALLSVASGALAASAFLNYFRDLPSPDAVVKRDVFQSTLIFDRNGEQLYEIWDPQGGRRQVVPLSEIPPHLIGATLATEDANFYTNPGFDPRSIVRAALQNFQGQDIVSGASTITQQLVRNTVLDPKERYEQSYLRKLKEVVLAYRLSQEYTKDQILQWYLNEINYGNLSYGVEAAAQSYFGKSAKDLNLAESALLAGLPQKPAEYNPLINLKAAKARQAEVLDLMVSNDYVDAAQAEQAKATPLTFATQQFDIKAPHFVMYIRELLEKKFGREKLYYGGLRVYTTLDYQMFLTVEKAAREQIARIKQYDANNAAAVTIDPRTGEILAMVGSVDYFDASISGQVNMALAERQPGSTLKPFTYATAFTRGIQPATMVNDQPSEFPGGQGQPPYRPMNHDRKWHGLVTLRQSLAQSLNIPAVLTLQYIGIRSLLDTLHQVGITTLNDEKRYGLALTLGSGEVKLTDLTFAYAALANRGVQVGQRVSEEDRKPGYSEYAPVAILRVTDSEGNVLEEYTPPAGKQVISPQITWLITDILSDDEARAPTYGRNSALKLSRPAAAKTGTTDDYRDAWTMGYTPDLVTGVWVGNADDSPMANIFGGTGAGNIWHNAMEEMLKDRPAVDFVRPEGVTRAIAFAMTTQPPYRYVPIIDWFLEEAVPRARYAQTGLPSVRIEPGSELDFLKPVTFTLGVTSSVGMTGTSTLSSTWPVSGTSPFLLLLSDAPPTPTPAPIPTPLTTPTPRPLPAATPTATPLPSRWQPTPTGAPGDIATVPDVSGLPEGMARAQIEASGLNNTYPNYQGEGDVPSAVLQRVAPGAVLSQNPAPGARVPPGTTVYLAIRKK